MRSDYIIIHMIVWLVFNLYGLYLAIDFLGIVFLLKKDISRYY